MGTFALNPRYTKQLRQFLHIITYSLICCNIIVCIGICLQLGFFDYTVFLFSVGYSVLDYFHLSRSLKNLRTFNEEKVFKRTVWVSLIHIYWVVMQFFTDFIFMTILGILFTCLIMLQYMYVWRFQILVERQNHEFRNNAKNSMSKGDVDKFVYSISDNFAEWEKKGVEPNNKKLE